MILGPSLRPGRPPVRREVSMEASRKSGKHADIPASFAKLFDEYPVARVISDPGPLYEVLTSPDSKTWTAILTPPGGLTCVIGTGEYWEQIALPLPGEQS